MSTSKEIAFAKKLYKFLDENDVTIDTGWEASDFIMNKEGTPFVYLTLADVWDIAVRGRTEELVKV